MRKSEGEGLSGFRPEFEAALRLFAKASKKVEAKGLEPPILVGGGAVELYSMSAVSTGDFDFVTGAQSDFESALQDLGFVRPSGPGVATRGWIHPELKLGFEVVASHLRDGLAERERVRLIDFGKDERIAVISVEDLIADRVGQFASGTALEMWAQALALYGLHPNVDSEYLDRRIQEETGGAYALKDIQI